MTDLVIEPDERAEGYVYLIRQLGTENVKIGHSRSPNERLASLQTANPNRLTLDAYFPASTRVEAALHEIFAAHRIHGEWFYDDNCAVSDVFVGIAKYHEAAT